MRPIIELEVWKWYDDRFLVETRNGLAHRAAPLMLSEHSCPRTAMERLDEGTARIVRRLQPIAIEEVR